jgi:alpha-tubulin suppressor-like RCC1 family protein
MNFPSLPKRAQLPMAPQRSGFVYAGLGLLAMLAAAGLPGNLHGMVVAWGRNTWGQLGDGTTADRLVPVRVNPTDSLGGLKVRALATGQAHSLALTTDGRVLAWGFNGTGALGDGTRFDDYLPAPVSTSGALAGKVMTAIAAGQNFSLAVSSDGRAYAWGGNAHGELGNGNTTDQMTPVPVAADGILTNRVIATVAAGSYHSLAVTTDGQVLAWGYNRTGALGDGTTANRTSPVAVTTNGALAGQRITAVVAGEYHSLALSAAGTVFSWGLNFSGQLGDGSGLDSSVPVALDRTNRFAGKAVIALAAGLEHSLALTAEGVVYAWGDNSVGQLGDGTTHERDTPVPVGTNGVFAGKRLIAIAAGAGHSLALAEDGQLYAWGANVFGRLGDGSVSQRNVPVAVDMSGGLTNRVITALAAGSQAFHSMVLTVGRPPQTEISRTQGGIRFTVTGFPTTTYQLQRAATLLPPVSWQPVTNLTTDATGVLSYQDKAFERQAFWQFVLP